MRRTFLVGAVIATSLSGACGSPSPTARPLSTPEEAEDRVTVVCDRNGSFASAPVVRALANGAHLSIDNRGGFSEYSVRLPGSSSSHGGKLARGITDVVTPLTPGEVWVGCYDQPGEASLAPNRSPKEVAIEIVDPDRLYQREDLECGAASPEPAGRFAGADGRPRAGDLSELVRRSVPGVLATDRIVPPGYPKELWKVEWRVIVRDGQRVAQAVLWGGPPWEIEVKRCPGIDIGS